MKFLRSSLPEKETTHGFVSRRPALMARMAFPALLVVVSVIVFVTSFVHYPEIVKARVVITQAGPGQNYFFADIDAPQNNALNIVSGQAVQLQFDEFPYTRFGYSTGVLSRVQRAEGKNNLTAVIYIPGGGKTNRNVAVPVRVGMKADIFITVNDMKLFQRVFYNSKRNLKQ